MIYGSEGYKNFRNSIITQLGGTWLFLEDCPTGLQSKYFPDLIEQAIEEYQNSKEEGGGGPVRKPVREYSAPVIDKIGDRYYFIAGRDQVHLLNHEKIEDQKFSRKLTEIDLEQMEVEIVWTGSTYEYENDEKEAFSLLCSIITKMNMMQDEEYHSVILGEYLVRAT